jgi:hypothetical protein
MLSPSTQPSKSHSDRTARPSRRRGSLQGPLLPHLLCRSAKLCAAASLSIEPALSLGQAVPLLPCPSNKSRSFHIDVDTISDLRSLAIAAPPPRASLLTAWILKAWIPRRWKGRRHTHRPRKWWRRKARPPDGFARARDAAAGDL